MKKLVFLILSFSVNILTFGDNVYFDNLPGYIYDNGQSFYSNQEGRASIPYHITTPGIYYCDEWGANFQDPNGNWQGWSRNSTSYGLHDCIKAGTWHVQARVHVDHDIWGYSDYWMYTSFTLYFNVYDNYAPGTPQNVTSTWVGGNGHPLITWSPRTEADMGSYTIAKQVVGTSYWMDQATVSAGTTQWIDTQAWPSGKFDPVYTIQYKIKANDINNNVSTYSSITTILGSSYLWKSVGDLENEITEYKLYSNYPNPFNPSTQIAYKLLEDGFVNLTVYNSIGQQIAVLVNSYQTKGKYSVQFGGENLPSGIYIYKLQSGNFSDIKKMLLTK